MYRSPISDMNFDHLSDDNDAQGGGQYSDQGMIADFVDSVQSGFFQGLAGLAETADQLTGYGGGVRDWLSEQADNQLHQMSKEGQDALSQQIFNTDKEGNLTLSQGALNARTWLNYLGQGIGTIGSYVATGGVDSLLAKGGAKILASAVGKKALTEMAAKEAAKIGFKGKARAFVSNAAVDVAVGNGMLANSERDKYNNMSFKDLQHSPEFSKQFWGMRNDPENRDLSDRQIAERARSALAEEAASKAFRDPKLTAINAISGLSGALGGRGLWGMKNVFEPGKTFKTGFAKGMLIEGVQEGSQSTIEQLVSNENHRDFVDPDFDITRGLSSNALNDAVIGAILGGAHGGAEGYFHARKANAPTEEGAPDPYEADKQESGSQETDQGAAGQRFAQEEAERQANPQPESNAQYSGDGPTPQAEAMRERMFQQEREARRNSEQQAEPQPEMEPESNDQGSGDDPTPQAQAMRERMMQQEREARQNPEQRAAENPITGNLPLDTAFNELDDSSTATANALRGAKERQIENALAARRHAMELEQQQSEPIAKEIAAEPLTQPVNQDDLAKYGINEDYQPTEAAQRIREEQGIALRDELERLDNRPQAEPVTPSQGPTEAAQNIRQQLVNQELDNNQQSISARRDYDQAAAQRDADLARSQQQSSLKQDLLNRLASERTSSFADRPSSMKLREQGKNPDRDFAGLSQKNKGMSKRLRRKIQRAKGFDTNAVLEQFQQSEKRLQAYEQEAKRQAEMEAQKPENIARRKSAQDLFADKMESKQATEFKENLITSAMNNINEVVDNSHGTVLEMDGQQASLPEVKRQLSNGVHTLANKFIGKTAALNERLRAKKSGESSVESEPISTEPESALPEQVSNVDLPVSQTVNSPAGPLIDEGSNSDSQTELSGNTGELASNQTSESSGDSRKNNEAERHENYKLNENGDLLTGDIEALANDDEEIITHQGGKIDKIDNGIFDGLFGSYGGKSTGGLGREDHQTSFAVKKDKIAGYGDRDFDYDKTIEWLNKEFPGKTEEEIEDLYRWIAEDKADPWDDNILADDGFSDPGDASWEAQRLRGQLAKSQGFDAVEMDDETGVSVLIPSGSGAKVIARNYKTPLDQQTNPTKAQSLEDKSNSAAKTPTNKTQPKPKTTNQPTEKIEDFGEVLHGARKHLWGAFGEAISSNLTTDDIKVQPLSKLIPKPNYKKLHEQGVSKSNLAMISVLRGKVPTKPRKPHLLARWVEGVDAARKLIKFAMDGDPQLENLPFYKTEMGQLINLIADDLTIEQIESLGNFDVSYWNTAKDYVFSRKKTYTDQIKAKSIEELAEKVKANFKVESKAGKAKSRVALAVYIKRYTGDAFIGLKAGSRVIEIKSGFKKSKDAREYLKNNRTALEDEVIAKRKAANQEFRSDTNRPRSGIVAREGNVTPEDFTNAFGFRGVQFGNWVESKRRQQDLNNAYDALVDLANITGIDTKAISLGNKLGLAFGARGKGKAAAHFEPNTFVINLTKKNGKGSLAHEWFHAMDRYFGGEKYATEGENSNIRPEMAQRWNELLKAIKNSEMATRSEKLDNYKSKPYWSTDVEMAARAFEAWVIEQNSSNGITNDYLANVLPGDSEIDYPYPTQKEMEQGISAAYSAFFREVKQQAGDNGSIALYSLNKDQVTQIDDAPTKEQVKGFVKNIFTDSPDLAHAETLVDVVNTEKDLPNHIQQQIANDGVEGKVNGAYDPIGNRVYLIADKIATKEQAERFIFHELVGHHGLRNLFGQDIKKELANIRSLIGGKNGVLNLARKMGVDLSAYVDMTDRALANSEISAEQADYILFDELLAHVAEDKRTGNAFDRLIVKVKNWLRRHGFKTLAGYGKADMLDLLTNIRTSLNESSRQESGITVRNKQSESKSLYSMTNEFKANLKKAMTSLRSRVEPVKVMETPSVLEALGVPTLPITITRDIVRKVTNGQKDGDHAVSMSVIENLPKLLSDPIAVFTPKDQGIARSGSKNIWVEAKLNNGKPVVVILHADMKERQISVNRIASAYGKEVGTLNHWAREGLLEYVRSKDPEWLRRQGLQLPKGRTSHRGSNENSERLRFQGLQLPKQRTSHQNSHESILTKEDIVNKGKVSYSLSANPSIDEILNAKQNNLVQRIKQAIKGFSPIEALGRNKYAMLTLRQIGETAGFINKGLGNMIGEYQKEVNAMVSTQNTLAEEAATISDAMTKWAKKDRKAADEVFKFAHDATLADVDPSKPFVSRTEDLNQEIERLERAYQEYGGSNSPRGASIFAELKEMREMRKQEPSRQKAHARLRPTWGRLSKEQKAKFREMRDHYIKQGERFDKALEENIERAVENKQIRKEMLARLRQRQELRAKGLYFPLARFGDYWVDFADKNGERQYMMFESKAEMEAARDKLRDAGYEVKSGMKAQGNEGQRVSLPFVADVMELIRSSKMNKHNADTLSDQVYQMYLRTLPGRSLRRNFIHRKGVGGFSKDAIRVLAQNGVKQAHQQARLDHMDILDNHLVAIQKHTDQTQDNAEVSRITEELSKRHEWVRNPRRSTWAQKLNSLGFSWLLGATPAASLVNLSQNLQVALPVLGSQYGFLESSGMMLKVSKEFINNAATEFRKWSDERQGKGEGRERGFGVMGSYLKGDERDAFRQAVLQGAIDTTNASDLMGLAENPNAKYSGNWNKAMNIIGWTFHNAEVFNREVTFISAYRLAKAKYGDHQKAVDLAIKDTWDSHFDYTSTNRARFMQSDGAAVAFQFKQYSQNMAYFLWSNLAKSIKGETPEVKMQARRQLLGTLAITFAIGGLGALPLGMLTVPLNAAQAAFGDDDEPWDAETELKAMLTGAVGKENAALIWYGSLPSISGRISLNDLWVRSIDKDIDLDKRYLEYMKQGLGPVLGGIGVSFTQGLSDIAGDGFGVRSAEKMLPKAVRDMLKTARYINEGGVYSRTGSQIVGDLSSFELAAQAMGFSSSRASIQYDENNAIKNYEMQITKRRSHLMNAYYTAYRLGDKDGMKEIAGKIDKWNQSKYGKMNPITSKSIKLSIKTRENNLKKTHSGLRISDKYQSLIKEYDLF